jgi:hypothetical protein
LKRRRLGTNAERWKGYGVGVGTTAPFDRAGTPDAGLCDIFGPLLLPRDGFCGSGVWLPIIAPLDLIGPFGGLCDALGTCALVLV